MHQTAIRLVLITLVFLVVISYPVAAAFNHTGVWLGVPALVWYLFAVWALLVVVLFFAVRNLQNPQNASHE
jgi:membrane protein implicated in regulation of membrane protease activity